MRRRSVLVLLALAVAAEAVSVAKSTDNDIVLKVSADKHTSRDTHHFSGEWLESAWGDLYQFRAGDQNWLTAREHCLSLNADLAVIRNVEQLDWILSHYAPLSSRFAQRLVQIGLYAPEGQTHEWKWLNGDEINKTLQWNSGEPYDHSMEGRERCGLLNVEKRLLDDVDCETTPADHHAQRYICQRTSENHKQQQRSNNYIWQKIENLFSFFGIGATATPHNATATNDYEDEVVKNETTSTQKTVAKFSDSEEETSSEEEESVIKTLAALPKIEGSGESTSLKELQEPEGSGQIVEKKAIETAGELAGGVDEKKLDKMIDKMEEMIKSIDDLTVAPTTSLERTTVGTPVKEAVKEEKKEEKEVEENKVSENIEGDFDEAQTKDMPKADIEPPKKEEDCDEEGSGSGEEDKEEAEADAKLDQKLELAPEKEDKIKEFLGVLRLFLDRAEHGDLRKLLDDQSGKTLLERMKNAVREANKREFEMLEIMENAKKSDEKEELTKKLKGDQMSTEEQKDLFKKISSAVMKAAKEQKTEEKTEEKVLSEPGMEKFNIAQEKIEKENDGSEGKIEVLKSAAEGKAEEKTTEKVGDDDYYGDYLDDNNVVKVQNREKKDASKEEEEEEVKEEEVKEEEKKEEEKKEEEKKEDEKKEEEKKEDETKDEETKDEEKKEEEKKDEEKKEEKKEGDAPQKDEPKEENTLKEKENTEELKKEETTTGTPEEQSTEKKSVETTTGEKEILQEETTAESKPSVKPAEAEEDEAELEASGHEEVSTTTESTTVAVKEVPVEEIEKLTKLEAKQSSDDEPLTETSTTTEASTTTTTTSESESTTATSQSSTAATKTSPVTVSVRKVSEEEMEKLSKMEATEKVTLLPPLPTFTFPTLAPFTFPTLPTLPTTKPTPAPKVPTLEEILGNLNDQFKKLLAPPKPLPKQ